MISLNQYASYDSIRAILGVPEKELKDVVLDSDVYAFFVQLELDNIGDGLRSDFETVDALTTRTTEEQTLWDGVRVFSAYAAATKCVDSLPQFSPKTISDGKAEVVRHSDSPYVFTATEVRKSYISIKKALQDIYDVFDGGVASATVVLNLMGTTSPDYDPVTGT